MSWSSSSGEGNSVFCLSSWSSSDSSDFTFYFMSDEEYAAAGKRRKIEKLAKQAVEFKRIIPIIGKIPKNYSIGRNTWGDYLLYYKKTRVVQIQDFDAFADAAASACAMNMISKEQNSISLEIKEDYPTADITVNCVTRNYHLTFPRFSETQGTLDEIQKYLKMKEYRTVVFNHVINRLVVFNETARRGERWRTEPASESEILSNIELADKHEEDERTKTAECSVFLGLTYNKVYHYHGKALPDTINSVSKAINHILLREKILPKQSTKGNRFENLIESR